jgi:transketolase
VAGTKNLVRLGAYVLEEGSARARVTLIATGSEVEIAVAARARLEAAGVPTRVVSAPCLELFAAQPETYRRRVLGSGVRVAVEAGVRQGWDRWLLGEGAKPGKSAFVGMTGFGASAPAERLYKEFGITAEKVAEAAQALL